ncbi:MAG: NADP oxidoreductase, partial [Rhodocyclaceae bacterium]
MSELSSRIDPSNIVNRVVAHHGGDAHDLVQILREVQEALDWISPETIDCLVTALGVPRTKIEAVAGFYSFFYLVPRGRYRVLFSDNITDRMAGSEALKSRMCRNLWIEPGKVSEDGLVSVDLTSCTGMCDQGPGMLVNNRAITRVDDTRVDAICDLIRDAVPLDQWPADFFRVDSNIRRADMLLGGDVEPGAAVKACVARGAAGMLEELRLAGLRGRGGAGFATATKWTMCREAPGEAHYVVCNADEGEPGTFKDRVLLTERPDLVFEGMTLCAQVLGARRGFLYLRGEYRYLLDHLNAVLARRRAEKLLGENILGIPGADFDIEIHLGAGAYVCGEESALIESLEGKRGVPRIRPPYPVMQGY